MPDLALLLALPAGAGGLLAVGAGRVGGPGRGKAAGVAVSVLGLLVAGATLALAARVAGARPALSAPFAAGLRLGFGVDALSAAMSVTVAAVTLLVLLAAAGRAALRSGRFVGVVLVFAAAMLATVTATTLPALIAGWEAMGAASWLLIAHHRARVAGEAATTAFVTTRVADAGLYVAGGAALAGGVGTLALADLPRAHGGWLALVTAGVVVAALGKSAQLPFSSWLSGAMVAPSPVSALLHSATMVAAGAYLLVRLGPLLAASGWGSTLVAWVGGLTAVALGLAACAADDLKQLLAASTCAQVGTMVLGAGVGAAPATTSLLVVHAAVKALLFLAAGAWLAALGARALPALSGAARRYPVLGVAVTIGALALAGVPPLSLWWAKEAVLGAPGSAGPLLAGQVAATLSAVSATRLLWFVWRPAGAAARRRAARTVPLVTTTAIAALALPAAGLGALLVAAGVLAPPALGMSFASTLLALAAAGATWLLHIRPVARPDGFGSGVAALARGWWGLDAATRALVVRPMLALAGLAARADAGLEVGVRTLGTGTLAAAELASRAGEAPLAAGIARLGATVRRLGSAARRPQTGQLHQYYAQAATGLGAAAGVAVVLVVLLGEH